MSRVGMDYSFLFPSTSSSAGNNYSWLSEYSNIKSGTYYKVLKAYYAKQNGEDTSVKNKKNDKSNALVQSEEAKKLDRIQTDAKSLTAAADELIKKGSDSVFTEKEQTVKAEDGTETTKMGYDTTAIYNAVKKFADGYNSLLDSASSSDSNSILNQTLNMTNNTRAYEKLLNKVGITIGTDNKLSVDEKTLKAANMSTVKTLFQGNTSYAYSVSSRASMLQFSAASEANKTKMYTNKGGYDNSYSTGNLLNSIF